MKPGNGRSEGCGRKAKRRGDTLHTAHDAPIEMPDRSRAKPLHLRAAGAQAGAARARDDRPARGGEPKPKPAKIRAVSYEAAIDQLFKRMRSSSSAPTQQAVSTPRRPVPNERRRGRPPHGRRTGTTGEWPPAARGSPPAPLTECAQGVHIVAELLI